MFAFPGQKGREDEWNGRGRPVVYGIELPCVVFPGALYLLDPAQSVCMLEGNIAGRVHGERPVQQSESPDPPSAADVVEVQDQPPRIARAK